MRKRHRHRKPFSECSYHSCKRKGYLFRCKYCGGYFCQEHLRATPPGPPRFRGTGTEDRIFMNEWHKEGGHPCPPYLRHWEEEKKQRDKEYDKALNRETIAPIKAQSKEYGIKFYPGRDSTREEKSIFDKQQKMGFKPPNKDLLIAIGVILLLIASVVLFTSPKQGSEQPNSSLIINNSNLKNLTNNTTFPQQTNINMTPSVVPPEQTFIGCWINQTTYGTAPNQYGYVWGIQLNQDQSAIYYVNTTGSWPPNQPNQPIQPSPEIANGIWQYNKQGAYVAAGGHGVLLVYSNSSGIEIFTDGVGEGAAVFHRCS